MKEKSIIKNFIANSILNISAFIFPLITFPYVSRILNPIGMGKISFISSVVAYLLMIAQLGIPTYGIKMCAKVRNDRKKLTKLTHELLIINSIMSIIAYIILFIILVISTKLKQEQKLLFVISSSIFFNTISVEWLYKGMEEYGYITKRSLLFKVLSVILMFMFIHNEGDYIKYGAITVFSSIGSGIFNFINMRKYIDFRCSEKYNFKNHIKPIFTFFAMNIAITIYTNLDIVMLGIMKGDAEVAYYNAAVKIKLLLTSVVASLGTVLLPRSSYYLDNGNKSEFFMITQKALNFIFVIGVPIVIFFILDSEQGILLLAGESYRLSIVPMKIIMPTVLIIGLTNIMGFQMLVPLEKEKYVLKATCYGGLINIVLNLILIPKYASIGVSLATLASEIVVLIALFVSFKNIFFEMFSKIQYFKIITSALISSLVVLLVNSNIKSFIFSLIIGGLLFGLVYIACLIIFKESLTNDIIKNYYTKKINNKSNI